MVLISLPKETRWESSTSFTITMGPRAMKTLKESSEYLRHHVFPLLILCRIFASKDEYKYKDGIFQIEIGTGNVIKGIVHVVPEGADLTTAGWDEEIPKMSLGEQSILIIPR